MQHTASDTTTAYWWLSFADPDAPAEQQFLGVAIVKGIDVVSASMMARLYECNPGGEVAGYPIPPLLTPPERYLNRLLTRDEAKNADLWMGKLKSRLSYREN